MAETSGPWDGSGFAQDEWRDLFGTGSSLDGILGRDGESHGLNPSFSTSNREITFSPGRARVRGNLYESDASIIIDVPVPSGSNQRVDYVVLRYDPTEVVLADRIKLVLVQGSEAASPSPPALTQNHTGVWEWPRIRIGPYGAGAISGAPWRYMGLAALPGLGFVLSGDPNDRVPGLSTVHDALVADSDGMLWRYAAGQYQQLGAPLVGSIAAASGWAQYNTSHWIPQYRKSADGLVTVRGIFRRTGSTIEVTQSASGIVISGSLPASIRPSHGVSAATLAWIRVGSSTGTPRHGTVRMSVDSSGRFIATAATGSERIWASSSVSTSWISIDGASWWV
jgi:hypothetical protein